MENLGGPLKSFPLAEQAARTEQARRRADRPDFEDYERTFHHLSDGELRWKHLLFRIIGNPTLNRTLNGLGGLAVKLRLPGADWAVRQTIYEQFVGGRSLAGAQPTIEKLGRLGVESILDYGAEAKQNKEDMDEAMQQILRSVHFADRTDAARATVVKLSSIIPFALLEKYNEAGGAAGAGEKEIPIDPEFETDVARLAAAEADYCIKQELALYPIDFIERRSGRLYFDMPSIAPVLEDVLDVFARAYDYSPEEREAERRKVEEAIAWVSEFEPAPEEVAVPAES